MKRLLCWIVLLGGLNQVTELSTASAQTPTTETPRVAEAEKLWQPSEFFRSLTWGGFVETSYTFNFENPSDGNENLGRAFDTNSNEFMLNAVVLKVGRDANKDQYLGFQVDTLAGQDAPTGQAIGLFKDEAGASQASFDLVNAHMLLYCPATATKFKIGKFLTPTGAEGFYSPDQWNFSRSFLWTLAIPISHTGLAARQRLIGSDEDGDSLALEVGITNGWDNVKDLNEEKMFYGSLAYTPCAEFGLTTNFLYSFSEQPAVTGATGNVENARQLLDIVANIAPFGSNHGLLENLKFIANLDWGGEEGASGENAGYASWYGFAAMAKYDFAMCGDAKNWYLAGRGEYLSDRDGSRTSGLTSGTGGVRGLTLWEFTATIGWKPWENLLLRTELRHDRADSSVFAENDDAGEHSYQTTLGFIADFIF